MKTVGDKTNRRSLQPHELPGWPPRMDVRLAAAYLGVSPSKLDADARRGAKPIPVSDGRLKLWLKIDLDRWLEREHGLDGHVPRDTIAERIAKVRERQEAKRRQS